MITVIAALALIAPWRDTYTVSIPAPDPDDFIGRNVDQARWGVPTITGGDFKILYSTPQRYSEFQGMYVEVRIIGGGKRRLDFPLMIHRDGLWERVQVKTVDVGP